MHFAIVLDMRDNHRAIDTDTPAWCKIPLRKPRAIFCGVIPAIPAMTVAMLASRSARGRLLSAIRGQIISEGGDISSLMRRFS